MLSSLCKGSMPSGSLNKTGFRKRSPKAATFPVAPVSPSLRKGTAMSDLLETLRLACDDPMWADHVEMPKKLLRHAIDRLDSLTADLETVKGENAELRRIVGECASALGNGAYISTEGTLSFMALLPQEIRLRVEAWAKRALAAEAKLAGGEAVVCRSCKGTGYSFGEVTSGRICIRCSGSGALTHPAPTHEDGSGEAEDMLQTAKELRDNANGDCGAIQQAIHWERKAASHTSGEVTEAGIPKSISDAELSQWAEKRADDAGRLARELVAYRRGSLPQDVINLVIAARIVAFEDQSPEALRSLDEASEAFASRVPWDNEPEGEQ